MLWLILAISAYALLAVNAVGDRYLLLRAFPDTLKYAFYMGIMSALVFVAVPFLGFPVGNLWYTAVSLFSGAMFIVATAYFYRALQHYESSRIVPAIGGILPLFTLGLTFVIFPVESVSLGELFATALFIIGSVIVTAPSLRRVFSASLGSAAMSAFLFGVYFVSLRYVYSLAGFWQGFLWTRIGGIVIALLFLFVPHVRRGLFSIKKDDGAGSSSRPGLLFVGNKAIGGAATVLQNGAVFVAPPFAVPVINALQGTQYVFLIILAFVVSKKFPSLLEESFSRRSAMAKTGAILLFLIGMASLIFQRQ